MNQFFVRLFTLWLFFIVLAEGSTPAWTAEPKVQVLSPKDGSRITQEQKRLDPPM